MCTWQHYIFISEQGMGIERLGGLTACPRASWNALLPPSPLHRRGSDMQCVQDKLGWHAGSRKHDSSACMHLSGLT